VVVVVVVIVIIIIFICSEYNISADTMRNK